MKKKVLIVRWTGQLLLAVLSAFLLFTGVSVLHSTFGFGSKDTTNRTEKRTLPIAIQRKPQDQKKQVFRKIRQMQVKQAPVKGGGNMDMRFTPDLGIGAAEGDGGEIVLGTKDLTVEIFDEGQVDEQAVPQFTPPVAYPQEAIELEVSGSVEVVFIVTYKGLVKDISIVKSSSPFFNAAVKRDVAGWKFAPAKKKGIPVNQRYRRTIEFVLE